MKSANKKKKIEKNFSGEGKEWGGGGGGAKKNHFHDCGRMFDFDFFSLSVKIEID